MWNVKYLCRICKKKEDLLESVIRYDLNYLEKLPCGHPVRFGIFITTWTESTNYLKDIARRTSKSDLRTVVKVGGKTS